MPQSLRNQPKSRYIRQHTSYFTPLNMSFCRKTSNFQQPSTILGPRLVPLCCSQMKGTASTFILHLHNRYKAKPPGDHYSLTRRQEVKKNTCKVTTNSLTKSVGQKFWINFYGTNKKTRKFNEEFNGEGCLGKISQQ